MHATLLVDEDLHLKVKTGTEMLGESDYMLKLMQLDFSKHA